MAKQQNTSKRLTKTAEVTRRLAEFLGNNVKIAPSGSILDMLIATILSQNTNDRNSYQAYLKLREVYPTWDDVRLADVKDVEDCIRFAGLAAAKSTAIVAALQYLHEKFGTLSDVNYDEMSDDAIITELTLIKGIGLKTVACVLLFAMGRDICPVDTHVHRVVSRLGIVEATSPEKAFHELRKLIPAGSAGAFHVGMIQFGRYMCKSRGPHCFECPMYDLCKFKGKKSFAKTAKPGPQPVSKDFILMDNL